MRYWCLLPLVAACSGDASSSDVDAGAGTDAVDTDVVGDDDDDVVGDDDDDDDDDDDTAGPTDTASSTDDSPQQLCVDTINAYRATLGLAPYGRWSSAESCADGQAQDDSQTGVYHGAFGECGEWAQNECPGWPGPVETMIDGCLAMMWAEGPGADFNLHGHYINMSSTQYTEVACGFYTTPGGSLWSVQDFR